MAEPIEEAAPPEEPAVPEVVADAPGDTPEAKIPVVSQTPVVVPAPEPAHHEALPEPETMVGDTPLSAIERLSVAGDLSPRIRRRDRVLTAAWAASFAILAGLGVAGYTERNSLMRQWPASKRVYATLGLLPLDHSTAERPAGEGEAVEGKGAPANATGQRPPETPPR